MRDRPAKICVVNSLFRVLITNACNPISASIAERKLHVHVHCWWEPFEFSTELTKSAKTSALSSCDLMTNDLSSAQTSSCCHLTSIIHLTPRTFIPGYKQVLSRYVLYLDKVFVHKLDGCRNCRFVVDTS